MDNSVLPLGKLPPELLARLLANAPIQDRRVLLGPGVGLDCAVVEFGDKLLVFKSDPVTFATQEIGWYAVQVSANDIATSGATPCWYLVTVLLPENKTTGGSVETISEQIFSACRELGISVIGGHTEITHGLDRPIVMGTLVGEVSREKLVTPRGAAPGNLVLLTKGVPIEATAILGREFPDQLGKVLGEEKVRQAADYLRHPGISVVHDARIACAAGQVTAMHDPTEGGLAAALWELAKASGRSLHINLAAVPMPDLALQVCRVFGLDPMGAIASGALLLTCPSNEGEVIRRALEKEGIPCAEIGRVEEGPPMVWSESGGQSERMSCPIQDEITKVFKSR
jgi:hydrogenase expression/formation protein HypE